MGRGRRRRSQDSLRITRINRCSKGCCRATLNPSGQEPAYRVTLTNERTFLAWIRTALAVAAGGALLE
ncbi:MAG: uncharacterized membrane protein YidH (DUF202 family) [Acidimicrobiales bacterium]|jgi:uncharacterized membrane protein YidH (DUF202 family)